MPIQRGFDVFLNCPFDEHYRPLLDAVVFAIKLSGGEVRSALEIADSGEPRLSKLLRLIRSSRFSIHDLSRVELDAGSGLPRFNMPIELGIAIGMKHFGQARLRNHHLLALDSEPFRYRQFASDLAGVDISSHRNDPEKAIAAVRDFLAPHISASLPGPASIVQSYRAFERALPAMAAASDQRVEELTFTDRMKHVAEFLKRVVGQ